MDAKIIAPMDPNLNLQLLKKCKRREVDLPPNISSKMKEIKIKNLRFVRF